MSLLTVTGGLTLAFVAFVWGFVKLAVAESNAIGHLLQAYKTFLVAVMAWLFLPGIADVLVSIVGWFMAGLAA